MSVKFGLMALLATQPMYGAQLRTEFEERTGGTWPLNVGQVYTTLGRLERDGLVEQVGGPDEEGRIAYRLTGHGRQEVQRWWSDPVDRSAHPRDELVIKLALAVTLPGVDVQRVVQRQRTATLRHLQELTRLKAAALRARDDANKRSSSALPDRADRAGAPGARGPQADHAWRLVLDNLIFGAEAEVRWLDHVEGDLAREHARARTRTATRVTDESHDKFAVAIRPDSTHGNGQGATR